VSPTTGARTKERAPGRRDTSRARELFRLGTNAYRSGRVEEARELLGEAWELQRSYDVAATLGQVEFELGHVVRANELLDFCLQNFPPIESDEKLAKMKRIHEKARSRVAVLEIDCPCDGALLRVDDEEVGALPLTRPLYVLPGRRILVVYQGSLEKTLKVDAVAGETQPVSVVLKPPAPVASKEPSVTLLPLDPRASQSSGEGAPTWPIYVGGGLVAVSIAAAVGFRMTSSNAADRAVVQRDKLDQLAVTSCKPTSNLTPSTALICSQLADAEGDEARYRDWSYVSFGAAAVLSVATVSYWVLSSRSPSAASREERKASRLDWSFQIAKERAWFAVDARF
jgi:hypothetical protein